MITRGVKRCFATSVESLLRTKLLGLQPAHLHIQNESASHSRGSESHFNVLVVADRFTGLSRLQKHQLVYELLAEELKKVHALTLTCKTPEEWNSSATKVESPGCIGKQPL